MVLIKLKIRCVDGTDTTVSIDDHATIVALRESIAATTSIPIEEQRLIFKGKVLSDDQRKLKDCGLSNEIVIHLVRRAVPTQIPSPTPRVNVVNEEGGRADQSGSTEHIARTISQIIGQVPFERNGIFRDPNHTMAIIGNIIQQLESRFRIDTQSTLHLNQPQRNDFSINVLLRGVRHQLINSPAWERFETLCIELRKLTWLVVLIQAQFLGEVDAILSVKIQTEDQQYNAMARVLRAMNAYDHYEEGEMNNFVTGNRDAELVSIIEQLGNWHLEEDEAHIQQLNPVTSVRHCTSHDLNTFLRMFSVVNAKIREHLMDRYYRMLQTPHIYPISSHPARMLNCFSNVMSRVQHYCAHIYHGISDFGLHADQNPHNRLYPQFVEHHRHEEPGLSQAEIIFVFSDPSNFQNARQPPIRDEQPPPFIFSGPSPNQNARQAQAQPVRETSIDHQIEQQLFQLFQQQSNNENGGQQVHFNPYQRPMMDPRQQPPNQQHSPENNNQQMPPPQQAAPANSVNTIFNGLLNIAQQFVGIGGSVPDHLQQQSQSQQQQTQQQQRPVAMRLAEAVRVPRLTRFVQPAATTTTQQSSQQPQQRQIHPPARQMSRQSIQIEYQPAAVAATIPYQFMAQPSTATGGATSSMSTTLGRSSQTPPPFPTQPPHPDPAQQQYRSVSAERAGVVGRGQWRMPSPWRAPISFRQQNVNWRGRPAVVGNNEARAMFIGPNEPTEFPMFTMDRFLACPSRRYRLFEMDSRHFDFWNDPRTMARCIEPPPNSIAGWERAGDPPPPVQASEIESLESLFNLQPRPRANANGDAIFNEIGQFAQFARRLLENVANCMARHDVRLLLPGSIPQQRGFTAGSRVAGYTPFIAIPVPFPVPSPPTSRSAAPSSSSSARPGPSSTRTQRGGFVGRRYCGGGGGGAQDDDPMDLS